MAKISGTQVEVGIAIESLAAAGTPVAPVYWIPWTDFSVQGIAEKALFNSARGIRNMTSNSMIKRKYAQGSVGFVPNVEVVPFFLSLACGSVATATAVGETVVYDHTFTIQNSNASLRTATLVVKQGGIETARFANVALNSFNVEVSDEYAKMTAELIAKFPDTTTGTPSYSAETEFAYHQLTAKFGTDLTAAAAASATKLKSFALNLNNNLQVDDAFLSGSNELVAGGLVPGRLQITGSYSLLFEDTTELAKYRANTKHAAIFTFTGADIGVAGSGVEQIVFKLGRLVLTRPPVEYSIDGLVVLTQEFEVEFDATDKEFTAVVTNDQANAAGARYNPA